MQWIRCAMNGYEFLEAALADSDLIVRMPKNAEAFELRSMSYSDLSVVCHREELADPDALTLAAAFVWDNGHCEGLEPKGGKH